MLRLSQSQYFLNSKKLDKFSQNSNLNSQNENVELKLVKQAELELELKLDININRVHPNPGPIFPCSVCAENVIWRGESVQCCTSSKWVHLRCSQLSLSTFRALGSSHSWSCPPAVTPWLSRRTPPTCIPPLYNLLPLG